MGGLFQSMVDILPHVQAEVERAIMALAVPTPLFVVLAFATKGRRLAQDVIRAARQSVVNILMLFTNAILAAPVVLLLITGMGALTREYHLSLVPHDAWDTMPPFVVGFVAVLLSDFIGYWRHRLEHTPLLWPSHAVHHSDDAMTWLAIFRFHPINRLSTTIVDFALLLSLGVPEFGLMVATLVKHNYGAFIHADLPWTYGRLGRIFVSPAMHRWHHANDPVAYNTNYATVFSLFDRMFGTYRVPGPCSVPLGVSDDMGRGFVGQITYPLRASSYRHFRGLLADRWQAVRRAI